jgi:PIN domain nuclease of toxin-antitoxin system
MSGVLLDTHTLLWYADAGGKPLSAQVLSSLEAARASRSLFFSSITAWEIGMLVAKNRLNLSQPVDEWLRRVITLTGIRELPLDMACALESTRLPPDCHGDPADRFLIASARIHDMQLATADSKILTYGKVGHLRTLAV